MTFSYESMIAAHVACSKHFGSIFDLPVIEGIHTPLRELKLGEGAMLDFGCGPECLKSYISAHFPNLIYTSLDSDPAYGCDYTNLEEIPLNKHFRLIIANQVLEHLTLENGLDVMVKLSSLLDEGGAFLATVPNVAHPTRFCSNADHKTYLPHLTLYYFASYAKLNIVGLYRYSKRSPHGLIEKFLVKYISAIYRMDWADSIAILAVKKEI